MSVLRAENLGFSYYPANNRALKIFSNLDLNIREGEIFCILGPSGCGKSTLLKILAGFLPPGQGGVFYRDHPVLSPFIKGQMVFQDTAQLFPWLTVKENIVFPLKRKGWGLFPSAGSRSIPDLPDELLKLTGLTDFQDYYPAQLSGGMKQRCALARALFAGPDLLFMDEPFVSLDAPSRSALQKVVLELWKTGGKTILFVTHDIPEALLLSDRLMLITDINMQPRILDNPLPRPRRRMDEDFLREEGRMYSYLESSGMTL